MTQSAQLTQVQDLSAAFARLVGITAPSIVAVKSAHSRSSGFAFGLNPVMAALLGMVTSVGGGMMRDILLAEIPTVLRADLYVVAALAGATVVVIGSLLHLPPSATTIIGALLCFGLRLMAIHRGWHLPIAKWHERSSSQKHSSDDESR